MSTSNASTKTLSSQSPDAQNATNGAPVTGNDDPAPTEPEGGYPEQKHAGAVGYGPEYGRMHQATAVEKFEGLKEQLVGKVTHNPDKAEHGRELRTGELKRRQQQENDNTDPFKTAGGDKPGQAKTSGGSSDGAASNAAPTPVVDNGGPGATHPTEAGAREQAATTAPEGTREAGRQAQGGNTDKQKMLDESSTARGSGPYVSNTVSSFPNIKRTESNVITKSGFGAARLADESPKASGVERPDCRNASAARSLARWRRIRLCKPGALRSCREPQTTLPLTTTTTSHPNTTHHTMPSFIDKLKPSSHKHENKDQNEGQEQQFTIQPHPAKTNDPRDLEPPQLGGGLSSNPEQQAFHTPGPYIPSQGLMNNAGEPKSREELKARSAELNR